MKLTGGNFYYIGRIVEGFLFGFYTGIFAMYWKFHTSKEESKKYNLKQNTIFYALCILYVLSAAILALDITSLAHLIVQSPDSNDIAGAILQAQPVLFGCCDFIAQSILIYRCWIVWSRNIRVVIIPSILALAYLAMWTAGSRDIGDNSWGNELALASLASSLVVNALVTGLILHRILKVFRRVKSHTTSEEKSLGVTRGRHLHSVIFIMIESGMILFAIQLVRLAMAIFGYMGVTIEVANAYKIIISIHNMLNGITPTIILVRVSMRLSFQNESSLEQTVSSLRFGPDNFPNGMGITSQDSLYIGPDDP